MCGCGCYCCCWHDGSNESRVGLQNLNGFFPRLLHEAMREIAARGPSSGDGLNGSSKPTEPEGPNPFSRIKASRRSDKVSAKAARAVFQSSRKQLTSLALWVDVARVSGAA